MTDLMRRFWTDESGQGLTEYALIIALVSIGLFAVLLVFRNAIRDVFTSISDKLGTAPALVS
jgi:pilus assembly protein Flp/PilA